MPPRKKRTTRKKRDPSKALDTKTTSRKSDELQSSSSGKDLDEFNKWKRRVQRSQEIRTRWEDDYEVKRLEEFYLGKQRSPGDQGIVVNHFLSTIRVTKPNLFYVHPKFFVRPKPGRVRPVEERHAATAEGVLDSVGNQNQNLKRSGSLAVLQAFFRIGVLKIVYDPRLEPNPMSGEQMWETDDAGEPIRDQQTGERMPLRGPRGTLLKEPEEVITDEAYRYTWVDAANMLLPDEGPDMSRWSWIGEEVILDLEDAKEHPKIKPGLRSRLEANETKLRPKEDEKFIFSTDDKTRELFRYFELYDVNNKKVRAFADGQFFEEFLWEEDYSPGIERHPYAILPLGEPILGPDPNPWPLPLTFPWLELQNEWNIRRQQVIEAGKRAARKGVFADDTFPNADEAVKALEDPTDMTFVRINDIDRPPLILQTPDISGDIWRDFPVLQQDWQLVTGRSSGKLLKREGGTATEATFLERASNLIDADMQDDVNDWLNVAGTKMLQMLKATMTLGMWVKMRGFSDKEFQSYIERTYQIPREAVDFLPGLKESFRERFGEEKWLHVTREDLQFQAVVQVVPGSSRPRNLEVERNQWLEFLRVIGTFPQLALSRELLRETAAKFEHIPERMLDELTALAQKMIDIQNVKAGRTQGGGDGAVEGGSNLQSIIQAVTGGVQ